MRHALFAVLSALVVFALATPASAGKVIDLTSVDFDATPDPVLPGGFANGVIYQTIDATDSSGAGVFNAFVSIQNSGSEKGYNTEGTLEFDTKGGQATEAVQYSSFFIREFAGGERFLEVGLDLNESQAGGTPNQRISLDHFEIWAAPDPGGDTITGYDFGTNATEVYDSDVGSQGNVTVLLRDDQGGSGTPDLIVWIPEKFFLDAGVEDTDWIILYSELGNVGTLDGVRYQSEAGPEEWAFRAGGLTTPPITEVPEGYVIPEPSSFLLVGLGLAVVAVSARRRRRRSGAASV